LPPYQRVHRAEGDVLWPGRGIGRETRAHRVGGEEGSARVAAVHWPVGERGVAELSEVLVAAIEEVVAPGEAPAAAEVLTPQLLAPHARAGLDEGGEGEAELVPVVYLCAEDTAGDRDAGVGEQVIRVEVEVGGVGTGGVLEGRGPPVAGGAVEDPAHVAQRCGAGPREVLHVRERIGQIVVEE